MTSAACSLLPKHSRMPYFWSKLNSIMKISQPSRSLSSSRLIGTRIVPSYSGSINSHVLVSDYETMEIRSWSLCWIKYSLISMAKWSLIGALINIRRAELAYISWGKRNSLANQQNKEIHTPVTYDSSKLLWGVTLQVSILAVSCSCRSTVPSRVMWRWRISAASRLCTLFLMKIYPIPCRRSILRLLLVLILLKDCASRIEWSMTVDMVFGYDDHPTSIRGWLTGNT